MNSNELTQIIIKKESYLLQLIKRKYKFQVLELR